MEAATIAAAHESVGAGSESREGNKVLHGDRVREVKPVKRVSVARVITNMRIDPSLARGLSLGKCQKSNPHRLGAIGTYL